jgi:steroid 5-alpha reductase family enzyme
MPTFVTLLLCGTLVVGAIMTALWLLGIRHRNFSYVDIGWSANFAVLALVYGLLGDGAPARRLLLGGMFAFWGLRLAWHLAARIVGEPEEGRYVHLRGKWGGRGERGLNLAFLAFFQLQAALNLFLSLPLLIACLDPAPVIRPLEWLAVAVWALGLAGESIADAQLRRFKAAPANKGRVCAVGLWRYSRHPNYFFEWTIWIAYALFALASPPWGWLGLLMPALMLHFLVNVTGIRATEEQALRSRGDAYRRYQESTSAFVPWFPRRPRAS